MTTITLTEEQYKNIIQDFYAPPEKRSRLSQSETVAIADGLNKKIDIPIFLSEEKEQKILVKIVTKIDGFLYDNLPNEVYDLIRSLPEGISDDEARRIVASFSKLANDKIDIKYIPEVLEYIAISFVINVLVNAMRKNWTLGKALETFNAIESPSEAHMEWDFPDGNG
ncbi:hypothetical protein IOQ59_05260 [Pontibacterium sp. N1Y112]|uniref:Uncharacterized protein n=1 Tax=Pontibacterium sinense TaxID=2781979 RepID=A0A8J7FAV0_9GAMM|nr:hypothetical protein [Pontibacterium sinense]MBE9396667.1 hypothetical protein [Pontibacterium sinense]